MKRTFLLLLSGLLWVSCERKQRLMYTIKTLMTMSIAETLLRTTAP